MKPLKLLVRYTLEPHRKIGGGIDGDIFAYAIYDNFANSFIDEYTKKGFTRKFLINQVQKLNREFDDYDQTIRIFCRNSSK